jgi:hypothetical protein
MAELYAGLIIAWESQAEHEAEFAAENTIYTPGLSETRIEAINAAQELPDGQARGADAETLRLKLIEENDTVIGKWNSLDGYISKAYKGDYYKPRIEEAGKQYYEKAVNLNWEYVKQLLVSGNNFLTAHGDDLTNKGGMPVGFADSFIEVKKDFDKTYGKFKDAQQDSLEQTDEKIKANNAIYKDGREMMEDGKRIFRKNAAVRDRFVWERILELVTPPTGGTTVTREGDLKAGKVKNVDITGISGTPESMVTLEAIDSAMRYYTSNVAGGPQTGGAIDLTAGQVSEYTAEEFALAVGLKDNKFLNVLNTGAVDGHFKMKATHVK